VSEQTFSVTEFGGLVTSVPAGAKTLRFRRAEGFAFRPKLGGLTTVNAPAQRGVATANNIDSVFNPSGEALYIRDTAGTTLFRALDANAWSSLGTAYGQFLQLDRGVGVQFLPTVTAAGFDVKHLVPTTQVSTIYTPSPALAITWTATADATSGLPAGNYRVECVAFRKVTYGQRFYYVRCDNASGKAIVNASGTIAITAGQALYASAVTIDSTVAYGIFLFYAATGTLNGPFFYGIVDAASMATAKLKFLPTTVTSAARDSYYSYFSARVRGDTVVSRQQRTWVAVNAARDYTDDDLISGIVTVPPPQNKTLFYSNLDNPWQFAPENYLTLSIEGDITALAPLGDALAVFSRTEIWAVTGNSPADFRSLRLDQVQKGAVSRVVVPYRGDVYYLADDGLYKLTSSGSTERLSDAIYNVFVAALPTNISMSLDVAANVLNLCLGGVMYSLDLERGEWLRAQETIRAVDNDRLAIGNGIFSRTATVSVVTRYLQTQALDLGKPEMDKTFRRARWNYENIGVAGTATLRAVDWDGTVLWSSSSQAVNTGRGRLSFPIDGTRFVNRGAALLLELLCPSGVTIVGPLEIDFDLKGRRNR
jgi:hypothetical protein